MVVYLKYKVRNLILKGSFKNAETIIARTLYELEIVSNHYSDQSQKSPFLQWNFLVIGWKLSFTFNVCIFVDVHIDKYANTKKAIKVITIYEAI